MDKCYIVTLGVIIFGVGRFLIVEVQKRELGVDLWTSVSRNLPEQDEDGIFSE